MTRDDASSLAFLAALQLGDPSLPIGRFVHSYGLEEWLATHELAGDSEIEELIVSFVREGVAPLDGAASALAHRAGSLAELVELDGTITAHKTIAPARLASHTCGRQLAAIAPRLATDNLLAELVATVRAAQTDGNLSVVSGTLARALGIDARKAVLLELRGAMTGLLSSAIRLGRLGPVTAQELARRMLPDLVAGAEEALALTIGELRSSAFELDIAALAHGRRDARTFAT